MNRLPNFLYIGTSKAGSTWLYDVLSAHPDVHMAPGKSLHFFSRHHQRGLDWYRSHFSDAGEERILGEVSHGYLYEEKACDRICAMDPEIRLMACLREPVDRAFSEYLDGVKNGRVKASFEIQIERDPWLLERGRYARYLAPYLSRFGKEKLHVGVFDELGSDPGGFAQKLFDFLGVEPVPLSGGQTRKMMPAGKPRSHLFAQAAKRASYAAGAVGLRALRGRVKRSRRVRNLLYRPYAPEEKPVMHPETRERLRASFTGQVEELDSLLGTRLRELWQYS